MGANVRSHGVSTPVVHAHGKVSDLHRRLRHLRPRALLWEKLGKRVGGGAVAGPPQKCYTFLNFAANVGAAPCRTQQFDDQHCNQGRGSLSIYRLPRTLNHCIFQEVLSRNGSTI